MSLGLSILIGVLTGVISAILIAFFNNIYKSLILPWFQKEVYQGVLLEGKWCGSMKIGSVEWAMTLTIKQRGNKVAGSLTAKSSDPNAKKKETDMFFDGSIYDGYLIISCTSKDPHDISFGAMILKIKNRKMTGQQIFRDLSESKYDVFRSNVEFEYDD